MALYRTWSVVPFVSESAQRAAAQSQPSNPSEKPSGRKVHSIPVRIREMEVAWVVDADVPGVPADAIGIEHFQDRLTIRYERKTSDESCSKFDDRVYGSFERIIRITDEIRSSEIAAKLENGVLRLEIPKSEALRPRTIPVTPG